MTVSCRKERRVAVAPGVATPAIFAAAPSLAKHRQVHLGQNRRNQRIPPVMCSVSPVIHAESGDARNTAAGAMSCGWPIRPRGLWASTCLRKSLSSRPAALKPSVSTMPGLMALTRILRGPSSLASERVTASTAALVALYTEALGGAAVLATELILTML